MAGQRNAWKVREVTNDVIGFCFPAGGFPINASVRSLLYVLGADEESSGCCRLSKVRATLVSELSFLRAIHLSLVYYIRGCPTNVFSGLTVSRHTRDSYHLVVWLSWLYKRFVYRRRSSSMSQACTTTKSSS